MNPRSPSRPSKPPIGCSRGLPACRLEPPKQWWSLARRADLAHANSGPTAAGETTSTKSRLRTIFLFPGGAFSEKYQVAKFDLIEKSFLTVISCYRIGASLLDDMKPRLTRTHARRASGRTPWPGAAQGPSHPTGGAIRGAGARGDPARPPPTAVRRRQRASMAKNHRNRKGRGPRPPRPPGKRLVPKPLFQPSRAARRESRHRFPISVIFCHKRPSSPLNRD